MVRRDRLHYLYPVVALGAFAALTSWLERIAQPAEMPDAAVVSRAPDMMVDHFSLQRFDGRGRQQYVFSAESMRHFAQPERTELTRPELLLLRGSAPVLANAQRGRISQDGNTVTLEGSVRIVRNASPDLPEGTLSTDAMTLWPEQGRAEGHVQVRYSEGESHLVAGRFVAERLEDAFELDLGDGVSATLYRRNP